MQKLLLKLHLNIRHEIRPLTNGAICEDYGNIVGHISFSEFTVSRLPQTTSSLYLLEYRKHEDQLCHVKTC